MISQKNEWLTCPPALLRTTACLSSEVLEVREDLLDGLVREVGPFEGGVRVVDVGLVVLVVVDAHRLLVDVRLESPVVVGKRWDFEGHVRSFPRCVEANRAGRAGRAETSS
jgi:hypothetical protein